MKKNDLARQLKDIRLGLTRLKRNLTFWGLVIMVLVAVMVDVGQRHELSFLKYAGVGATAISMVSAMLVIPSSFRRLCETSPSCPHCHAPLYNMNMQRACLAVAQNTCPQCHDTLAEVEEEHPENSLTDQPMSRTDFTAYSSANTKASLKHVSLFSFSFAVLALLSLSIAWHTEANHSLIATTVRELTFTAFFGFAACATFWASRHDKPTLCPICGEAMDSTIVRIALKTGRCGLCGMRVIA